MGIGKNILIIFVSVLLIISLIISVTFLTASSLLYPEIYVGALEDSNILELLENQTENIPAGDFIEIPEEGLEIIAEEIITNLLLYLRGSSDDLNLTIGMNGTALRKFFENQAENFPICSPGQEPYSTDGNPVCRPSEKSVSDFLDEVFEMNNITIPESREINLVELYNLENENIEQIRSGIIKYQWTIMASIFLSLFFSLVLFFISRDYKKGSMIIGINLLISGIIILIISSILTSLASNSINIEFEFFKDFVSSITESLISTYQYYGMSMAVLGITASIVSATLIIKNKRNLPEHNLRQNHSKPLKTHSD